MIALLALLFLVPILAFRWTRLHRPARSGAIVGFSFGLVVSPASFGLYAVGFFVPFIGILPTLIGGMLMFMHGPPGFHVLTWLGLRNPREVVTLLQHVQIELLNAALWSLAYGTIGAVVDRFRAAAPGSPRVV